MTMNWTDRYTHLWDLIASSASLFSDNTAIVENGLRWSYQTLYQQASQLALALQEKGIQPQDKVALFLSNQKEFVVSFMAILKIGAVVVPINIQQAPDDIGYVLLNSGSRLLITSESFAPAFDGKPIPMLIANQLSRDASSWEAAIEAVPAERALSTPPVDRDPAELAVLIYTTGTTGKPKGVMLSENNLLHNMAGFDPIFQFSHEDRMLLALPLFHAYGLIIGLYGLGIGAQISLVPKFAPKSLIETLIQEKITIVPLVPTLYGLLLEQAKKIGPSAFSSIRYFISGGASLPPALLKDVESTLNVIVLEGYGMTETSPVLAVNRPDEGSIPRSVGKPLPNVEIALLQDSGERCFSQPGQESPEGEILAKGPNVMLGYYGLPEETQKTITPDGWLSTGDLGRFDGEGRLYISGGRKKDLIIKAGENIAPVRIEQTLYAHPDILEACVLGIPDTKLGEKILACVILKPETSLTEQALKKHCREDLPALLVPDEVHFMEGFPKHPSGKILKHILKNQLLEAAPASN